MKLVLAAFAGLTLSCAAANACEVSIAENNWDSAMIGTAIEKFFLEESFGCKVDVIATSTVPGLTSMMEKGKPDVMSEVWMNTEEALIKKGLADGKLVDAGPVLEDGAVEAWYITKKVADEHPDIRSVYDVLKNPQLFPDPENPEKGAFYNCPSDWVCQRVNNNLLRAYGLDEKFTNINPGSAEALAASIARASTRGEPWFGYYFGPTSVLGKYPMVRLEMEPFDEASSECMASLDCKNPVKSQFQASVVNMLFTEAFRKREPEAAALLDKISFSNEVIEDVMAWKETNKAETSQAAGYFVKTYPDVWEAWVDDETAQKIRVKVGL